MRANTDTLVWTRLIHLLSSTLWSHLNLKTIILETSPSWNTVQALWIVMHSSSVSPRPLNSDPRAATSATSTREGSRACCTQICFCPIPFFNNSPDGNAGGLAGLGPINKETHSQVGCNQADTNRECSNSIWSHALQQHVQTGFDGDHKDKCLAQRLIFIKGATTTKNIFAQDLAWNIRDVKGRAPEPTADVFLGIHWACLYTSSLWNKIDMQICRCQHSYVNIVKSALKHFYLFGQMVRIKINLMIHFHNRGKKIHDTKTMFRLTEQRFIWEHGVFTSINRYITAETVSQSCCLHWSLAGVNDL